MLITMGTPISVAFDAAASISSCANSAVMVRTLTARLVLMSLLVIVGDYCTDQPPSMVMTEPVMKVDSSLAR